MKSWALSRLLGKSKAPLIEVVPSEPAADDDLHHWIKETKQAAILVDDAGCVLQRNTPARALLDEECLPENLAEMVESASQTKDTVTGRLQRQPRGGGALDTRSLFDVDIVPLQADGVSRFMITARDITLETNLASALTESRRRFKDLVECSVDFAWEVDAQGCFCYVSSHGALGFPSGWLDGQDTRVLIDEAAGQPNPFLATHSVTEGRAPLKDKDGSLRTVSYSAVPLFDDEGKWRGARGVCRDITLISEHEEALAKAHSRARILNELITSIRDCVEPESMLQEAARQTGLALGAPLCAILRYDEALELSARYVHDDKSHGGGETLRRFAERGVSRMLNGGNPAELIVETNGYGLTMVAALTRHNHAVNGAVCVARPDSAGPWTEQDMSLLRGITDYVAIAIAQFASQERLKQLARTDDLTGLLNRRGFIEQVESRLELHRRQKRNAALLFVDLDNFKQVNDKYGHDRGDLVLRSLGLYLEGHTRGSDCCARLGGDEFAVWLDNADEAGAIRRAQELVDLGSSLQEVSGRTDAPLSLSVGVVMTDPSNNGETLGSLLDRADKAMYGVKRDGKSDFVVAPPSDWKKTG